MAQQLAWANLLDDGEWEESQILMVDNMIPSQGSIGLRKRSQIAADGKKTQYANEDADWNGKSWLEAAKGGRGRHEDWEKKWQATVGTGASECQESHSRGWPISWQDDSARTRADETRWHRDMAW